MSIDDVPSDIEEMFRRYIATEFAYVTAKGEPLCWPVTPYWDPERKILSISTGLAYPTKAQHAKRNPKVALLFSDPTGSGLVDRPQVLVQGDATVLDDDIQANTDRYVTDLRRRFPMARLGINALTAPLLDFYLPRLWVEVKPVSLKVDPRIDDDSTEEQVDFKPLLDPSELRSLIEMTHSMGEAVVTTVEPSGYPFCIRSHVLARTDGSIILGEPAPSGPASLTFHHHSLGGTRFRAWMARGSVTHEQGSTLFIAKRLVGFFGNGLVFPFSAIRDISTLRKRLKKELARRGQPMPKLRIPR